MHCSIPFISRKVFPVIFVLSHTTVGIPQQPIVTCNALEQLIANRNATTVGDCVRNTLCTSIRCDLVDNDGFVISTNINFDPRNNPIIVQVLVVGNFQGESVVFINETLTNSQQLMTASVEIVLLQTDNGVIFGVS